MRHGRRTFLTADDVDAALALRNLEVILFCFDLLSFTLL
jgi:hypothetical protein